MSSSSSSSSSGRKREWRSMDTSDSSCSSNSSSDVDDCARVAAGCHAHGEVIEKEMKRLRLAHEYDASLSTWNHMSAQDEPMDVESDDSAAAAGGDHNYAAKNHLLRECHYLRQLRKFQSERMRERASYLERRGVDASTQYIPPQPRY